MESERCDQYDVVHACCCSLVEDLFDDELSHVGSLHRRERERHVVEGDGEAHPRPEQLRERGRFAERMFERVTDRTHRVVQAVEGLRAIENPAPTDWEPF